MRTILILACLLIAGPAMADDQDLVWDLRGDEESSVLAYGVPETDHQPIAFSCMAGEGKVSVSLDLEPASARGRTEVTVDIVLQSGGTEIPVRTVGERWGADEPLFLEGTVALDDRLVRLLTSDGPLRVRAGGDVVEHPLDTARSKVQPFLRACR